MKSRFIFVLVASVLVLGILVGCGAKPTTPDAPNQAVDPDIPTDPNPSPNEGENPPSLPNDTPADPVFYGVTLEHDSAIGTVNGLKERYEAGETVTFTVESSNYMVDTITCNGAPITEQDGTYSFAIGSDVTISITYQLKPTTVNVTNDSAKGTVLGLKNEYAVGDRVTFTVSPNAGWAVYSVSVNGEELTLPYSYLVTDASPRDISLAVTYEEDTLEARRNKVVAYAKHLTGDYYHYEGGVPVAEADINNSTHNHKALSEDFIYRGVPYNEGLTSLAAYRTLPSEFVDGVYHITPTLFVQRWYWLFGLSCADIPLWSWRAVSGDVTFAAAQQMTPAHGCIQVGIATFCSAVSSREKQRCDTCTQLFDALFVIYVVATFMVGQNGRSNCTVGKCGRVDCHRSFLKRMNEAAFLFQCQFFVCQRHSKSRQKSEIIAEREARALSRAFAHLSAKTAIKGAVTFLIAQAQLGCIGANVAQHFLTPLQKLTLIYIS